MAVVPGGRGRVHKKLKKRDLEQRGTPKNETLYKSNLNRVLKFRGDIRINIILFHFDLPILYKIRI